MNMMNQGIISSESVLQTMHYATICINSFEMQEDAEETQKATQTKKYKELLRIKTCTS